MCVSFYLPSDSTQGARHNSSADPGGLPALPSRANAIHMLHCPETPEDAGIARQRLALDEFVALQRDIRARRLRFEARSRALPARGDNRLMKPFLANLRRPSFRRLLL